MANKTEQINLRLTAKQRSFLLFEAERTGLNSTQVLSHLLEVRRTMLVEMGIIKDDE